MQENPTVDSLKHKLRDGIAVTASDSREWEEDCREPCRN